MKLFFCYFLNSYFALVFSQNNISTSEKKINYEYKKYEKFDFGELGIDGSASGMNDFSLNPRFQSRFNNQLPRKNNFHREMYDGVTAMP